MGAGAGGWNWGTGAYRQITLEEAVLNAYVPVYVRSRVLAAEPTLHGVHRMGAGAGAGAGGLGLTDR